MTYRRPSIVVLVVLLALFVSGTQLRAALTHEQRAFAAACAEFQDKFYDRAETNLTQFLVDYHKSTNAPEANLLLAQAQFYLGKFPDAIGRLTDTNNLASAQAAGLADQYVYWTAEARFAGGDYKGAAETFISLPDRYPRSALAVNAVVEAAAALGKLGNWPGADELLNQTNSVFRRFMELDPTNEIIVNGRLLLAESRFVQRDYTAAVDTLKLLNGAKLSPEQDWTRAHLLCRANIGRNDLEGALSAATNLLQIARAGQGNSWPANLAESVVIYASLLEQSGRLSDAVAAWAENLTNTAPVEQQQRAILKTVELSVAQNNLTNAEAALTDYLTQFQNSAVSDLALLTLGELYLKDYTWQPTATNQLVNAEARLNQFISVYTNSPLMGKAILDQGWCFWLNGQFAESLADFQASTQYQLADDDRAVATFKAGDAQFALAEFANARDSYEALLEKFSHSTNVMNALGDRAVYQVLRSQLELKDTNGMDHTMSQFLGTYFTNAPADSGLLLAGQGFSSFGSPAKAREVFLRFENERTNSTLMPDVAFAVGRTFEREGEWLQAVVNYNSWLQKYPTNYLRAQVEYARDWAVFQSGNEAGAFDLFTNYITAYTNNLTPLAYWWVADHYFRQGTNFVQAEYYYQTIFQNFSTNELAARARLMAGRAALGRSGYSDASRYFLGVLTDGPDNLKDQARFGYCEVLWKMAASETNNASLQQATNYLSQMYNEPATNVSVPMAWCETGDCNFQMGALDAATNAYAQVLGSPVAGPELRNRAQVGIGLVLEKKAEGLTSDSQRPLLAQALGTYADVIYNTNSAADPFWMKKAALQALPLMAYLKEGDVDRFVDSVIYWLPPLKDTLEKKRATIPKN